MLSKVRARLSPPMVVALLALFVAMAGTTYAGNGDNFILGVSNSAGKTTTLTSGSSGAALATANTGTGPGLKATSKSSNGITGETQAAGLAGVFALNDGTSAGDGLHAVSLHGNGVNATGPTAGGTFSGSGSGDGVQGVATATGKSGAYAHHDGSNFGYGVFAKSTTGYGVSGSGSTAGGIFDGQGTGDGVQGSATATGKSGLWGHHDGGNNGYGVFAQSDNGPAIGMKSNTNSAPMTLDGNPFPSATAGWKHYIELPRDDTYHPIATLGGISAGTYIVFATLNVNVTGGDGVDCDLVAGSDTDTKQVEGDAYWFPMTLMVFHRFTTPGAATVNCISSTGNDFAAIWDIKIAAIQVSGGTNTHLP
jgi:hypothetical protein